MASTEIENLDPAATVENVKKIAAGRALNRRNFLAAFGMTGVAAGAGLMSGCNATTTTLPVTSAASPAETGVMVFAMNLKYLEATFLSFVTLGADLPSNLTAGSGPVTGAPALVAFTGTNAQQTTDLLNEMYFDDVNQLTFLRTLLGSAAVVRPAINLAAYGAITATNAIAIARMLKDVASSAFASGVASLSSSNMTYAAQILSVESAHTGALRLISIQSAVTAVAADSSDVAPFDPTTDVLSAAGPGASGGFFATYGASAAGTTAGVAYARTTSQALSVLYGAPGAPAPAHAGAGGFFPKGVNGSIFLT